jgi:hypothetical protein
MAGPDDDADEIEETDDDETLDPDDDDADGIGDDGMDEPFHDDDDSETEK